MWYPGSGVVLNLSFPDLCRLFYFYQAYENGLTLGQALLVCFSVVQSLMSELRYQTTIFVQWNGICYPLLLLAHQYRIVYRGSYISAQCFIEFIKRVEEKR